MLRLSSKTVQLEIFEFYDLHALKVMISRSTGAVRAHLVQLHDWEIARIYADRQQLHYAVAITK